MTRIQQKINWIKMHALQEAEKNVSDPFITTWNMTSGEFTLLTQKGTYNATIDWGDGTSSTHTTGNPTHTYASAGQYQIKISGQYNGLRINNNATQKDKLIAVNQWGNVGFTSFEYAFRCCSNLVSLPNGSITGAEGVESFRFCFDGCTSLTTIPVDLFRYTVNVESFYACFYDCTSLTTIPTDLFRYNVNVTTFEYCFGGCTSLTTIPNGLFEYNVNVESFRSCFYDCKNLALPTSIFNLTALQAKQPDMAYCFRTASTADSPTGTVQPIWNYVTITARNYCFYNCTALANYSQIPELWR
ncbi:MAG: leucine-rich repeat protein [Clostridiales bacterium]|nr:leucine-rich repeat protein [Clostridiales bacterium]